MLKESDLSMLVKFALVNRLTATEKLFTIIEQCYTSTVGPTYLRDFLEK